METKSTKPTRKVRGYKITDKDYNRALKRANKAKIPLATQIEEWVKSYGRDGVPIISGRNQIPSMNLSQYIPNI